MSAIDILTKDHRKVDELFMQIEGATANKQQIFNRIYDELTMHSKAEETFFYPELELSSETSDEVSHSYKEHQEVKNLLEELAAKSPDSDGWMAKLDELKQNVKHHVKEEENELFPKATEVLGKAKLDEIGQKISQLKAKNRAA